jgi:DNA-binding MarR family transcriptional regulator
MDNHIGNEMARRYQVDDITAALMAERHASGDSFSKIARDFKIERRAVARIVRQFEQRKFGVATIRRDSLAQLFVEHVDDMKRVARVVLELTAPPSIRGTFTIITDIERQVVERLTTELSPTQTRFLKPPPFSNPEEEADVELHRRVLLRLGLRRAKVSLESLKTHVPVLKEKIDRWQNTAAAYQKSWYEVERQAVRAGVAADLVDSFIRKVLDVKRDWATQESLPAVLRRLNIDTQTAQLLKGFLENPASREAFETFYELLNRLESIYDELEEIASFPRLDKALLSTHCQYCPVP